ncbi:MAG: polysaccharide deacetylase family protein [Myxococcota bacterium]
MRNLYLHYVDDSLRLGVSADALRRLVDRERETRRPVSLNGPLGSDTFSVSFDDAHRSILVAADVLAERDVPATLFVPTGYVETSESFLRWDDLRALRDRGWQIGSHTVSHLRMSWRLYDEDVGAHRARLDRECCESREVLERELGIDVTLFAYPYGEDPEIAREAVRAAGYARAFTVRDSMAWREDPLSIPRLDAAPFDATQDEPVGISVVVPAYERAEILAEVVTRLASQSYPEDRYEVLVIDDGSESDLRPIFAEMPSNVRLFQPKGRDDTFRAGQARQYGANHASFPILAFLDADVAVEPDFLWHLDWIHRREADAVVLGYLSGYNLHDLGFRHTLGGLDGTIIPDRSREPTFRGCLDNLDWLETPWELCYTGNLSLPKALLDRIDGFADVFQGWGLEDVDLGVRLHEAGARWVVSRWAVGFHLSDPDEDAPRNPFRKCEPIRADFAGFEANLALLETRHGDSSLKAFAARSRSDIEETCGRPNTVGIEMGGQRRYRSPYDKLLHRVHPGGIPRHELLDRVAYASKVGASQIYLLGGAPMEHPAVEELVREARKVVSWVSAQTLVYPFADADCATRMRDAGLGGVTALVWAFDEARHEAAGPGPWALFRAGWEALARSELEVAARVIVTPETVDGLAATLRELEGFKIDEVAITDPSLADVVRDLGHKPCPARP